MSMRIIFMGSPEFSVGCLKSIMEAGHEIACVYSQPPRRAGRGKTLRPTPVHAFAETQGLEVRTPVSLKSADEQAAFAALNADIAVVVAYGLLLPGPLVLALLFFSFSDFAMMSLKHFQLLKNNIPGQDK